MRDQPTVSQLVVIGASSGGVDALSALVGALPADFPAPLVIAQHLSPTRTSHLGEILSRRSPLPVHVVEEADCLQGGVVYVVPPNRHVEVTGHELRLIADHGGPHPSVDLLFASAARTFGENVVAVILTGQGSDGAAGARAVKASGGVVMIQDPATAAYPSMPQALSPTLVDVVAPVERLGALLPALLLDHDRPGSLHEGPGLRTFLERLRESQGFDFTGYRTPTILRRLHRRLVATGTTTLAEYTAYLEDHPEEQQRLVQAFLIKVTEFFRDRELFDHLREQILPELIAHAREEGRGVRLWSAGCATGEEAYSLAILLADLLGEGLEQAGVRIFATDLDAQAVAFARRGVYPISAMAGLPPELIDRHFTREVDEYAVKKRVRSVIIFGQQDLGQRAPFPNIDLVLCRNVLIYFSPELQRRTLQLFAFALREGGYLALGKAETTRPLTEYFEVEDSQVKVFRRRGGRTFFPPAQVQPAPVSPALPLRVAGGAGTRLRLLPGPERPTPPSSEELLTDLAVGLVVVDRRYDIQAINPAARRLFGIHGPAIGEDFLHLVQTMSPSVLRRSIDATLRGERLAPLDEVPAVDAGAAETRYLQVLCQPRPGHHLPVEGALIQAIDVTRAVEQRRAVEEALGQASNEQEASRTAAAQQEAALRATSGSLEARVRELTVAGQQLREANEALVVANAELRGLSEEYLINNEEAQAATEEVETLNEELQATNEELETLNEELQSTVEELHATNDDLEARSEELQDLATRAEGQRLRLETILAGMSDAVLVVDAAGRPELANTAYKQLFGDPAGTIPAEDADGQRLPPEQSPAERAAAGETFTMEFAVQEREGERRWFEARGQPVQANGRRQGVVVIRDVTERSLRRLQEEFLSMASHELATPLTVIKGFLQMLLRALERNPAQARQYAVQVIGQVDQLTAIARDLVDVARLHRGQLRMEMQPVDLRELVRQGADLAVPLTPERALRVEAPEGAVLVQGDAGRLQQVLLNLLTNAIRYAPGTARIDLRLLTGPGTAQIQVQDYGPGIPPDQQKAIFSRFVQGTQANHGGLGLGLFIAREIVAAHSGTISVHSTPGAGTTFTVSLPLLPAPDIVAETELPGAGVEEQ